MPGFWKWARRLVLYPATAAGAALYVDDRLSSQRVRRNMRALWTGVRILYEYKMRWDDQSLNSELHRRVAQMILETCQKNGGLYVKFGQGIASMNHILPKEYNQVFQVLHDNAPYVSYDDVRKIIIEDLEVDPNLIFKTFDETPIASASIAQVHKATLYNGDEVAVKIQKPYIAAQVPWDLLCYKIILHAFEYVFDLPLVWSAEFTEKQMLKETDFMIEAMNGQKTAQILRNDPIIFDFPNEHYAQKRAQTWKEWKQLSKNEVLGSSPSSSSNNNINESLITSEAFAKASSSSSVPAEPAEPVELVENVDYRNRYIDNKHLREHVYVPRLYPQYCSKRILTAEWCEGVKCNNIPEISKLGFKFSSVMNTIISLFGHQIFVSGFVHCDPHPGNLLVRQHPTKRTGQYQIVFLDHGLYIEEPAKFRKEYALFWTSMFMQDLDKLNQIAEQWGIQDVEFFASLQLIKPFSRKRGVHSVTTHEKLRPAQIAAMQVAAKQRVKTVLKHTETIPRHLIFVGRNMNIVRANNKDLGSPVNRVAILGEYAARGANSNLSGWKGGADGINVGADFFWKFRMRMIALDIYYNWKRFYNGVYQTLYGVQAATFEDEIEQQMNAVAREMGLVVDENMFDA